MQENETNVAAAPPSPEPAKTAAIEQVDELAGGAPGATAVSSSETPVSYPDHHHDVAQVDYLQERIDAAVQELGVQLSDMLAGTRKFVEDEIESVKADIIKHVAELVKPIVASSAAAAAAIEPSPVAPHELAIGDPVKVWVDKRANTFRLGEIAAIHDGAHAFDVELDDGAVTKITADGLEFDDRR